MQIQKDVSLKQLNTFGIEAKAAFFAEVNSVEELKELIKRDDLKPLPKLILGGGSNILFTQDFPGLVIKNNLKGKEIIEETDEYALVKAMSGEVWHEFVLFCIDNDLAGIENLSLIPGSVGAAPIQNIGAYGVELQEVFHSLEAFHIEKGTIEEFDGNACAFGYRDSVFKNELKGKYFITGVVLKLNKKPDFKISYGAIQQTLDEAGIKDLTIRHISEAVCNIRNSKLPDPREIGNAGSFFKNPEITPEEFEHIKKGHPDAPNYPLPNGNIKVPAGWLIEQCGFKGKKVGNTGSHAKQALVLVNYGAATGEEIKSLAMEIQQAVKAEFGIEIQPEVNIV